MSVLAVEVHDGLHARGLAIQAVAAFGLLYIQVVVEALVKLLHEFIETLIAQQSAVALGIELVGNQLNDFGNILHRTVCIALQVGCL